MESASGSHDRNFFPGQRSNIAFSLGKLRSVPREDHRYGSTNAFWDPLRGDPRFEQIVASLAPKQ